MSGRLSQAATAGEAIRYLREARGLTEDALASSADVATSYLSHVEVGRKRPTPSFLKKILPRLECSDREYREIYRSAAIEYLARSGWGKRDELVKILYDHRFDQASLGQTLRSHREQKGKQAKDMARDLDINPAYLSRIEHDKVRPSLGLLCKYADLLGHDESDLLHLAIDQYLADRAR